MTEQHTDGALNAVQTNMKDYFESQDLNDLYNHIGLLEEYKEDVTAAVMELLGRTTVEGAEGFYKFESEALSDITAFVEEQKKMHTGAANGLRIFVFDHTTFSYAINTAPFTPESKLGSIVAIRHPEHGDIPIPLGIMATSIISYAANIAFQKHILADDQRINDYMANNAQKFSQVTYVLNSLTDISKGMTDKVDEQRFGPDMKVHTMWKSPLIYFSQKFNSMNQELFRTKTVVLTEHNSHLSKVFANIIMTLQRNVDSDLYNENIHISGLNDQRVLDNVRSVIRRALGLGKSK
jgi:hypothetical protein